MTVETFLGGTEGGEIETRNIKEVGFKKGRLGWPEIICWTVAATKFMPESFR